ncbi:MAG: competence protein ComEA [Blastocatellia bacterium]|jgi:competence protein ComEA|nr:competence protein ComEA [Blastocatellia bacterium]
MKRNLGGNTELLAFIIVFAVLTLGSACARLPRHHSPSAPAALDALSAQAPAPININTARAVELERLPGIGKAMAARIVQHRERFGLFRRPEHLLMVRGISDRKFRELRPLITVE